MKVRFLIGSLLLIGQPLFAQMQPANGGVPLSASVTASLGIMGHNHVALHVKDIPTSAAFYRDIIGLTPIAVPDNLKATRAWFSINNGQQVHLLDGRTETIQDDRNGRHLALFVRSIPESEQFLKQKNLPYHRQVRFDGVVQLYFPDPDGYLIELNEGRQ
jgi:catechol 2,3-dioxygenase-like lactoylglutathione lyase family enzyme